MHLNGSDHSSTPADKRETFAVAPENCHGVTDVPNFPVFIRLAGANVFIAGGGKVAARRASKLLEFGARLTIAAPELSPEMEAVAAAPAVTWLQREYASGDLDGATLAIAATNDRAVNHRISLDARNRGILVSVADNRDDCTFFFPALLQSNRLTAGLISNNGDHTLVRDAAAALRTEMKAFDENHTRRDT